MATKYWRGTAPAVAGVKTATPANVGIGNTFTITFPGGRVFTFTATEATVANVTAGLVALLQASADPLVAELTYEDSTTTVTITGPADGKPFDFTASASGGTATLTEATPTSPSGPNWWTEPDNWDTGTAPTDVDTAICESDVPILYGLATGITAIAAHLVVGGNQVIGLPENDPAGYSNLDYRQTFLEGGFLTTVIRTTGGRCKVDVLGDPAAVTIYATGSPIDSGQKACEIRGSDLSSGVFIAGGSVGLGTIRDPSATGSNTCGLDTVRITSGPDEQADVQIGPAAAMATVVMAGGTVVVDGALTITTVTKTGGELTVRGTTVVTTLNNDVGLVNYESSGTITLYRGGTRQAVEPGGGGLARLDVSGDHRALTITNAVLGPEDAEIWDPGKRLTLTNAPTINRDTAPGIATRRVT